MQNIQKVLLKNLLLIKKKWINGIYNYSCLVIFWGWGWLIIEKEKCTHLPQLLLSALDVSPSPSPAFSSCSSLILSPGSSSMGGGEQGTCKCKQLA